MNAVCPKCQSEAVPVTDSHYCRWCDDSFTPHAPNEAEKDEPEFDTLENRARQCIERLETAGMGGKGKANTLLAMVEEACAENARLTSKLAEMEKERDDWKREASQHLADTVKLTTGFNEVIDELTASRDSLRQELEKLRGEGEF